VLLLLLLLLLGLEVSGIAKDMEVEVQKSVWASKVLAQRCRLYTSR